MVEYLASGLIAQYEKLANHGDDHVDGHAHHGACILGLHHCNDANSSALYRVGARAAHRLGQDIHGVKVMKWDSWSDFFAMGGYALYVWGSFAVVFLFMAGEVLLLLQRGKSIRSQLANARAANAPRSWRQK